MHVSLVKCFLVFCLLLVTSSQSINETKTTYNNMEEEKERAALARILYYAKKPTDLQFFEKGFDLTPEEIKKFKLWPEGIIPYYVDILSFDTNFEKRIHEALEKINTLTGLRFFRLYNAPNTDIRWLFFINREEHLDCDDYNGHNFTLHGMQKVLLGLECLEQHLPIGAIILSLVGVPPQHNAPNRDEYIQIMWENIQPEKHYLFEKLDKKDWLFHDLKYDFSSAGHYSTVMYAKNYKKTIEVKKRWREMDITEGRYAGLSYRDIKKIKMLYNYISRDRIARSKSMNASKTDLRRHKFTKQLMISGPRRKPNLYVGLPTDEPIVRETTSKLPQQQQQLLPKIPRNLGLDARRFNLEMPIKNVTDDIQEPEFKYPTPEPEEMMLFFDV